MHEGSEALDCRTAGTLKHYGERYKYENYELDQNFLAAMEIMTKENEKLGQTAINSEKAGRLECATAGLKETLLPITSGETMLKMSSRI